MRCEHCGAEYDDQEPKCPYCGAFNYKGAEQKYLNKLEDIRDDMSALTDIPENTYKSEVKSHMRFAEKIVLTVLLIAGVLAAGTWGFSKWEEYQYTSKHADIKWYNEHVSQMDEWYEQNDFESLLNMAETLSEEEFYAFYSWKHSDVVTAYFNYKTMLQTEERAVQGIASEGELVSSMYGAFTLLYPSPYEYEESDEREKIAEYGPAAANYLEHILGFTQESRESFFEEHSENGVLSYDACRNFVKNKKKEMG